VPLLGQKLRQLRDKQSLLDVAKETGVSKIEISRYERGIYFPSPEKLKKLSEHFKVDYSELRKLYYQETLQDDEEQNAILAWVVESVPDEKLQSIGLYRHSQS
jgi:transcriptional regulator with XRE-family HTH domain